VTGQYRYLLANLQTGAVFSELLLTNVSAERSLAGPGGFSALMPLAHMTPKLRQQVIEDTTPAKCSVLLVRDGECLGEWIIWKRVRRADSSPVELGGSEFVSYLDHRLLPAMDFIQTEQLDIAAAMFTNAVGGTRTNHLGKVAATVATYQPSGMLRDRHYLQSEAFTGTRLQELSDVIDGFDYYVQTDMDNTGASPKAIRQLLLYYPRAGADREIPLEFSAGPGGAVVETGVAEDGEQIATEAWALGGTYQSGGVDVQVIGATADTTMITANGYPYLQVSGSWTSVTEKTTIIKHSAALLASHEHAEIPAALVVSFSDDYPSPTGYHLGDRFQMVIEPSINFPVGEALTVRLVGYTIRPPVSGPETLELAVIREDVD
jgi:hypothetical protein